MLQSETTPKRSHNPTLTQDLTGSQKRSLKGWKQKLTWLVSTRCNQDLAWESSTKAIDACYWTDPCKDTSDKEHHQFWWYTLTGGKNVNWRIHQGSIWPLVTPADLWLPPKTTGLFYSKWGIRIPHVSFKNVVSHLRCHIWKQFTGFSPLYSNHHTSFPFTKTNRVYLLLLPIIESICKSFPEILLM